MPSCIMHSPYGCAENTPHFMRAISSGRLLNSAPPVAVALFCIVKVAQFSKTAPGWSSFGSGVRVLMNGRRDGQTCGWMDATKRIIALLR